MTFISAFLIAVALATTGNSDQKTYVACRMEARAAHHGGCIWRSGSLSAGNGYYSTRIAFRQGRPGGVVIIQPGVSGPSEWFPAQAKGLPLHIADMSAIDGDYLVCALKPRPNPYDLKSKLDAACLAGAKNLRPGSIAWAFSDAGAAKPKRRRP